MASRGKRKSFPPPRKGKVLSKAERLAEMRKKSRRHEKK
jgi:hypothetical protein